MSREYRYCRRSSADLLLRRNREVSRGVHGLSRFGGLDVFPLPKRNARRSDEGRRRGRRRIPRHHRPDTYQNTTKKSRLRAIAAGRNLDYFVGRSPTGAQRLGVCERDGRTLHPILIFVDAAPTYRERLKFYEIAQATSSRVYQRLFKETLADAIATARLPWPSETSLPGTPGTPAEKAGVPVKPASILSGTPGTPGTPILRYVCVSD